MRSSGLLDGFLSMYGAKISTMMPTPGIVTPAIIGWNIVNSSCSPRKYQGALDGFGVWLTLASWSSGALTKIEKTNVNAVQSSDATNSPARRCGHVCTLSTGDALTSWIDPLLTTVSSRWVWPPGPAPTGTPAAAGGYLDDLGDPVGDRDRATTGVPRPRPAPPAALALAARLRSSRWAGIRGSAAGCSVAPSLPAASAGRSRLAAASSRRRLA